MPGLRREAFTIVELLAVIVVLGVLVVLFLPMIVDSHAPARRIDCANRERQIALAAIAFEADYQALPGYWMPASDTNQTCTTWPLTLSRYLGRQDLWDAWAGVGTAAPTGIPPTIYWDQMVCPSDPPPANQGPWLSYVVNCGLFGNNSNPADGVCFDQLATPPGPVWSRPARSRPAKAIRTPILRLRKHIRASPHRIPADGFKQHPPARCNTPASAGNR